MKTVRIILLTVIAGIGGLAFFLVCKGAYEDSLFALKQQAKGAFVDALNLELKSRNLGDDFALYFKPETVAADLPDSVYIENSSGRHWYRLDPQKHWKNITDDSNLRFLHSIVFVENPLQPDSLNVIWKERLSQADLSAQTALSVSVTDQHGQMTSKATQQSEWFDASSLIFTVYIGYACEIEVKGYLRYSWWNMLYAEFLLYLLLFILCVCGFYQLSTSLLQRLMANRQKEIIEVPVIQVVQGVTDTPVRSYVLHKNILFYAEQKKIVVDEVEYSVQTQSGLLLELFLNEKEHALPDNVILKNLWPDGNGSIERVHKAIARLRSLLQQFDSSIDIKRGLESYQLLL